MIESLLFSNYLSDQMLKQGISIEQLQVTLGYHNPGTIRGWLNGWSRPSLETLEPLSKALKADPVDMHVGWLIDQCPNMEAVFRIEILIPRGSKFPRTGDLTLRPSKPRPSISLCQD
jgi:transcriptional regulator with XRE-family HTH domain